MLVYQRVVKKDLFKSWFLAAKLMVFLAMETMAPYSLAGLGFIVHIFFGKSHRMTENTLPRFEQRDVFCSVTLGKWLLSIVGRLQMWKIVARLLEDIHSNPF